MKYEASPQNNTPIDILASLSIAQESALYRLHNKLGLPPLSNLIDMYMEDNPDDKALVSLLTELKQRLPETEDFAIKSKEIFELLK